MKVKSISRKLLTRVLSFYFILTVSVTGIQIVAEYFNTKNHINSELLTLEKTISGSLTRAVWELNTQQAIDISEGLVAIPMIKGITVTDEANNIITQLGEVISPEKLKINNQLKRKYKIRAFPTLVFVNHKGKMIGYKKGLILTEYYYPFIEHKNIFEFKSTKMD